MGVFPRYITNRGIENLKKYRYQSAGKTRIDNLLNPWWELVSKIIPLWIAPNVLTLLGFMCTLLATLLCFIYTPLLSGDAPAWFYFTIATLIFFYQTFDAVDGKHARRTNNSTPVGQLFDHGCDSFTTVFSAIIFCSICQFGISLKSFTVFIALQLQMFIYAWWELHFQVFRSCTGNAGVSEGQLVLIGMSILAGTLDKHIFFMKLGDILPFLRIIDFIGLSTVTFQILGYACGLLLLYGMLIVDIASGMKNVQRKCEALSQLMGWMFHLFCQYLLYSAKITKEWPVTVYSLIIMSSCIVALRLHVSAMCRMEYKAIQYPAIPFYAICCGIYYYERNANSNNYFIYVLILLFLTVIYSTYYLCEFIYITLSYICKNLHIKCFTVCK